jgi:hypothetical protein
MLLHFLQATDYVDINRTRHAYLPKPKLLFAGGILLEEELLQCRRQFCRLLQS